MRSLLFVPADAPRKLDKGLRSGADALILDLEDSVAATAKSAARQSLAAFLAAAVPVPGRPRLLVRINDLRSGAAEADLDVAIAAGAEGIVLPKTEGGVDVAHLGALIAVREAESGRADGSTIILAIATETAVGVLRLASLAGASPRLAAVTWGAEDLSADLGAETNRLDGGAFTDPYRLARSLTLMVAAAATAVPLDTVYPAFRDLDGLARECAAARRDGFVGKLAIHPDQVPVINAAFTPAPDAVAEARAIVAAFAADPSAGVVGIDGQMFDRPHLRRAERLLARLPVPAQPGAASADAGISRRPWMRYSGALTPARAPRGGPARALPPRPDPRRDRPMNDINRSEGPATDGDVRLDDLRPEAMGLPLSGIVEIFDYGRNRQGLIPLWVGEGDQPTPDFIVEAAVRALRDGETFYTYQAGLPELRRAIADYMTSVYGGPFAGSAAPFSPDRFFVTIGGMHAIELALRMMAGSGDEVLVPAPAWPNFIGAVGMVGASAVQVPMTFEGRGADGRWRLDVERLAAAVGPRTRAIVVNSPSNPTGWVASRTDLEALLDLARRHDLWILADEIYGRIVAEGDRAPSFHDIMAPDDRIMFVQTLSKNWSMTGWRIGWLEAPPALRPTIESLVQYSTSGVPVAHQRAAIAALREGEAWVEALARRVRDNGERLCTTLAASGRIRFARPGGAFYLFCGLETGIDSRTLALRLVDEAGIGVAPGSAFGQVGEGFVRICYARKPEDIAEVVRRLTAWMALA